MLGDHREQSSDSRVFGPIKRDSVIGRAWLRYWPLERLRDPPDPDLPGGPGRDAVSVLLAIAAVATVAGALVAITGRDARIALVGLVVALAARALPGRSPARSGGARRPGSWRPCSAAISCSSSCARRPP